MQETQLLKDAGKTFVNAWMAMALTGRTAIRQI